MKNKEPRSSKEKEKKEKKREKEPNFFSELGSFMTPYKGKYSFSVMLSILSVACSIGAYGFVGGIASLLFKENKEWRPVLLLAVGAVLSKILSTVLLNFSTWISHKAAYHTLKDIRLALQQKMLRLPVGYFEREGSGRLKTLMVDRVESMEKTLAHLLPELTANLLVPLLLLIWMFVLDWRLALTGFLFLILGFSVTSGMMKNYDEKYKGQIHAFKTMNQAVVEFVNGIEVIKNFGRTDACYAKYENAVNHHAAYNVNWQRETQKYTSLGMAIAPFSLFPILISGLYFYSKGTLEGGTLFLMILLSFGIFGPLMNASTYFDQLAGMGTDALEIKEILDEKELSRKEDLEESKENSSPKEKKKYDITYENVSFTYKNEEKEALSDISLHLEEGKMCALVGPSGSGKSTVAKLLAGFYDVTKGELLVGNRNIKDYSQEELNKMIAFVDQDTFLFDLSIEDNIRIGKKEASFEEVCSAAKAAFANDFITALPEGYKTSAGEAGKKLSGGEKQRIAIARAMMKNAPILILDEATASTDPENEAAIQKALSAAAKGKTLMVIAHRLHTVMGADQIVFMKEGKILSKGTHEELLQNCPEYERMWALSEVNS